VAFDVILVIANSGRMLVEAASKAGFKVLAIDVFADNDTQDIAYDYRKVDTLAFESLAPAVSYFQTTYHVTFAVYGSGFEHFPESLFQLQNRLTLLGNDAETFQRLQRRDRAFFAELSRLAIPYPEVKFEPPGAETGWLFKPTQGQGGIGITYYRPGIVASYDGYWQTFRHGRPYSALFLADGRQFQIIGFQRQWSVEIESSTPFLFAGLSNKVTLTFSIRRRIAGWLALLVPAFNLQGLNSLDFIQYRNRVELLEINPRPPASLQLYSGSLFVQHIRTCFGHIPYALLRSPVYSAYRIVYARRRYRIPKTIIWPDGCKDLPVAGTIIGAGQPICSMIAHQNNRRVAFAHLAQSELSIINQLEGFEISCNFPQASTN
jgi:predicted ATP-grasp superfamily ATP-dependent carboligase